MVMLLVLGLSAISITYMTSAQKTLKNITNIHNAKVDLLYDMDRIVRARSLHLHAMYFNQDPWRRADRFDKFSSLAPEFIALRNKFLQFDLTQKEKDMFSEAMKYITLTQKLQLNIRDKLSAELDGQARILIAEKDVPLESNLLSIFDQLVNELRVASETASQDAITRYNYSIAAFLTITLIIVMVVLYGSSFVGTRLEISENKLFEEKERAEVTLSTIINGVITTDVNGRVLSLNSAAANMIGWDQDAVQNKYLEEVYQLFDLGMDDYVDKKEFREIIEGPCMRLNHHHRLIGRTGREITIEETVSPIFDADQNVIQFSYSFRDVSYEHDKIGESLRDSLTGAMNRRFLETEMQRLIYSANEMNITHGFLYIDIDFFKTINDSHGHTAGDKVLFDLSTIMLSQIRQKDVLVRLGGDEFVVLVKNCELKTAELIAEKILQTINSYSLTYNEKILSGFGASIGISLIRSNTKNSGQILDEADRACYQVKKSGRNGCRVSDMIHGQVGQII